MDRRVACKLTDLETQQKFVDFHKKFSSQSEAANYLFKMYFDGLPESEQNMLLEKYSEINQRSE